MPEKETQEEKPLNQTIPGGKYIVDGKLFNAEGGRINEQGEVLTEEEASETDSAPKAKGKK